MATKRSRTEFEDGTTISDRERVSDESTEREDVEDRVSGEEVDDDDDDDVDDVSGEISGDEDLSESVEEGEGNSGEDWEGDEDVECYTDEDDVPPDEEIEFDKDDFDIDVDEQTLSKFNAAYGVFMDELSDKADHSTESCRALVLGRAQDIRPIPTSIQELRQHCAWVLITDDAKDLWEAIDRDLESISPLKVVKDNLEVCEALLKKKSFAQLFQYLAVLTDLVFDKENFDELKFPDAEEALMDLARLWTAAYDKAAELDRSVRHHLTSFLKQLPPKLDARDQSSLSKRYSALVQTADRATGWRSFLNWPKCARRS